VENYVSRLAEEKATKVALSYPDAIIIGSDQSLQCDGEILGKPGNFEKAKQQLSSMSGKSLVFYTGLCVLNSSNNVIEKDVISYRVNFRDLTETEIESYLKKEQPYQCAGSFMSEKLGVSLIASMEGNDPTALIGLPLIRLCEMLRNKGVNIP
jgi:7-methyl-GTP pyrophosphatase